MSRTLVIAAVVILALHGLIHLMGTTVYMKLGRVEGLSYKTTLLGGRWDLGEMGIAVYGALWLLAAVGFIAAAVGLAAGWESATLLLVAVTALSLVLTVLDWNSAFMGAIVNLVILTTLLVGPRLVASLP